MGYRLLDSTNKVFIQYHFIDSYIHNEKRYYIYNKELRRKYPNGEIAILKYNNLAENKIDGEFYYTTEPFTTVRVEYEHNCYNEPPSRLRYTFFTDYRNLLQKDELDFFLKNELVSIIK